MADLTGMRFGRLTVTRLDHPYRLENGVHKHTRYWCVCDCGKEISVPAASLTRTHKATRSCGCLKRDRQHLLHKTHGLSKTWEYKLLMSIKERCINPRNKKFSDYGGRGITIFQGWIDDPVSFINYIKDVLGPKPTKGHSLDRKENDKGYEPGNLRWATAREQCMNQRTNRLITFNGETKHLVEWARNLGISMGHLSSRIKTWPLSDALTTPKGVKRPTNLSQKENHDEFEIAA